MGNEGEDLTEFAEDYFVGDEEVVDEVADGNTRVDTAQYC